MTQDRRTVGSVALIPTVKFDSVISADLVLIKSKIFVDSSKKIVCTLPKGVAIIHISFVEICNTEAPFRLT